MIKRFADITNHIKNKFQIGEQCNIVFFFIDSCGWEHYLKNPKPLKSIKKTLKECKITKIQSQFPSITQCHITSAHLGMPVSETGIFSEKYYNSNFDKIVDLFNLTKNQELNINKLIPFKTFYQTLSQFNIKSSVFLPDYLRNDVLAKKFTTGASCKFNNFDDNLKILNSEIKKNKNSKYYFFYNSDVDSSCHHYGPYSNHTIQVYNNTINKLNNALCNMKPNIPTTIIIASDHGQINVNMNKTIVIQKDIPELEKFFKKDSYGKTILPGGAFREIHFYLDKNENIKKFHEKLQNKYTKLCRIYTKSRFLKILWKNLNITQNSIDSLGDIILIANDSNVFTWNYDIPKWKGIHGGDSDEEMYTACVIGDIY